MNITEATTIPSSPRPRFQHEIFPKHGDGNIFRRRVAKIKMFILPTNAHPVYGLAPRTVPCRKVASLDYETRNDPVKRASFVPQRGSLKVSKTPQAAKKKKRDDDAAKTRGGVEYSQTC